jgi:hypothetical protein
MKQWIAITLKSADHRLNTGSKACPAGLIIEARMAPESSRDPGSMTELINVRFWGSAFSYIGSYSNPTLNS